MSGIIQNFKENNPQTNNTGESENKTMNIPMRIQAYEDGKYFVGTRLDTNEQVKVFLRPVEQKGKYERIGIEKLSDPTDYKRYVEPNHQDSILMFEGCYQESDGSWNSRWVNVLSKPSKPAKVFVFVSNISLVNYQDNKFFTVNALKKIVKVNDKVSLKRGVIEGLKPKMPRMTPVVAVRFTDSIGDSVMYRFFPKKEKVNERKEVMQPEQYIEELWGNENFQKMLGLMENPEIRVELMFLAGMQFGADTNTRMLENPYETAKIQEEYRGDNKELLYKKTILALRERVNDNSLFLISSAPIENGVKGLRLEDL